MDRHVTDTGQATKVSGAARVRGLLFAALAFAASLHAPPSRAEAIDEILVERQGAAVTVWLRFTGPVSYLQHHPLEIGAVVNIYLQALAPDTFGERNAPDEVKHVPQTDFGPRFTVRLSLDPRCAAVPNPVCLVLSFEHAVRYRIRLGEDGRSLVLNLQIEHEQGRPAPAVVE